MSWEAAKNKKKCHLKSLLYEIFTVFAVDFQCIFPTSGQLISSVSIRHTSLGRTKLFQLNELLSILSIQFTFPKFPKFGSCLLRFRAHVEPWSIIWPKTPLKSDDIITISIRLSPSQILKFDVMFYFQSSIRNAIWNSHLHHQFLVTLLPPAGSTWQALWINKLHSGCN